MCQNCRGEVVYNDWGPWCDRCGGVYFKPGVVFFRHVATVEGQGGRFPIVYDLSTSDYAFMHKEPAAVDGKTDLDGFHKPGVNVSHGSLDAVIGISWPDARGEGAEAELSAAPSATDEEKALILRGF